MRNAPPAQPPAPIGISSANAPALDLPARFMAMGVIAFGVVAIVAPWALPLLLGGFYDPRLLAFVHLNTLGVIGAIIIGASYQLVPVVLQQPLASVRLGRLSFWCYLGGVLGLLGGLYAGWRPALISGGALLAIALALYVGITVATLVAAPERGIVAGHIGLALVSLTIAATLGVALVFNRTNGFLGPVGLRVLAAHATLMLGGWVTLTYAGVAYRLIGMFTLAEDALWHPGAWLELALTASGVWLLAASLVFDLGRTTALIAALLALAGVAMFAEVLVRLYQGRKRRGLDIHIPYAIASVVFGLGASGLLAVGIVSGASATSGLWVAAGWLMIAGLAETGIQGFFYKIAPFLVWLHRYATVAGRERVPRLEQMYSRRVALAGWFLWVGGIVLSLAAVAVGEPLPAHLAGALMAISLAGFLSNGIRIATRVRPAPVVTATAPPAATSATNTTRRAS